MAYYIYGKNTVIERIKKGEDVKKLYVLESIKDNKILDLIKDIEFEFVSKAKLDKLVNNTHHQGLVAEIKTYQTISLEENIKLANKNEFPLIVILDGIEDPHNLGAIMRTCDALGIYSIIVSKFNSAPLTNTVAKVSTGAIEYVKVSEVTNLTNTVKKLKELGYWVVGAEASGTIDYRKVDYKTKIALVVGSEGKGISKLLLKNCDYVVSLPMLGHVNSLNVSNATAILLYGIYNSRYPAR